MTERIAFGAYIAALLDTVPDAERDVAAVEIMGAVAAQLVALVGGRSAAAAIYPIADLAATQHISAGSSRG